LSFKKILAIQHRQMGDVLMCTPALSILKKEIPLCRIDFLTENIGQQVLKYNTHIDNLIIVPRKPSVLETWQIISRLRGEKYDAVIDFFGNPRAGQLTLLSGAPARCGFRDASLSMAYSRKFSVRDENEYSAHGKAGLVSLLGIKAEQIPGIEFPVSEEEYIFAEKFWKDLGFSAEERVVAFCPVSRRDYKMWPPEYFARVADALIKRYGVKIWFVYGPGERALAESVAKNMNEKYTLDYEPPTLPQLRAVMEKCKMYVGNDGGNKHIAVTAGIATATLFRQLNPANWTPPGDSRHVYIAEGEKGQPPLGTLTPEDMLRAVEKIENFLN
jgi:ADP-heptose:LPS heptosyltransferase